jgi:predicted nuclease with TOPRIM domain
MPDAIPLKPEPTELEKLKMENYNLQRELLAKSIESAQHEFNHATLRLEKLNKEQTDFADGVKRRMADEAESKRLEEEGKKLIPAAEIGALANAAPPAGTEIAQAS